MEPQAYLCLTEDNRWAIAISDGTQETILVTGRRFQAGADIREALAELEGWAEANGYTLTAGSYPVSEVSLEDLIEPEIFDEVFGDSETP